MPLTAGQAALCAMIFGVGVGSVGTTIIKDSPKPRAVAAKAKQPGGPAAPSPKRARPPLAERPAATILDCPVVGSPWAAVPNEFTPLPLLPPESGVIPGPYVPGGGGGLPVLPPPTIPEPGAWSMLIAGFGFVGLSLRRRKVVA